MYCHLSLMGKKIMSPSLKYRHGFFNEEQIEYSTLVINCCATSYPKA
jgi:hypothetical protein